MVTVLGGLAEFERHLILARTDEGRKRAQARGVRFGRKLKLTKHQRQEALARVRLAKGWPRLVGATTSVTQLSQGSAKASCLQKSGDYPRVAAFPEAVACYRPSRRLVSDFDQPIRCATRANRVQLVEGLPDVLCAVLGFDVWCCHG